MTRKQRGGAVTQRFVDRTALSDLGITARHWVNGNQFGRIAVGRPPVIHPFHPALEARGVQLVFDEAAKLGHVRRLHAVNLNLPKFRFVSGWREAVGALCGGLRERLVHERGRGEREQQGEGDEDDSGQVLGFHDASLLGDGWCCWLK